MAFGTMGVFQGAGRSSSTTINRLSQSTGSGGMGVASGVVGALGSIASGLINIKSMKNTMAFNRGMADVEKRIARLSAKEEIRRIRENANQIFGAQQASFAVRGLAQSRGTMEVMARSIEDAEMDAIFTQINADLGIQAIDTSTRIQNMNVRSQQIEEIYGIISSVSSVASKMQRQS